MNPSNLKSDFKIVGIRLFLEGIIRSFTLNILSQSEDIQGKVIEVGSFRFSILDKLCLLDQ
jgi:hypothetical protein